MKYASTSKSFLQPEPTALAIAQPRRMSLSQIKAFSNSHLFVGLLKQARYCSLSPSFNS